MAATVDQRFITVLGPIKMEILDISGAGDAETVVSNLQRPLFAFGANVTDTQTTSAALNVSISGRTLTLNNANLSSSDLVILVFGF